MWKSSCSPNFIFVWFCCCLFVCLFNRAFLHDHSQVILVFRSLNKTSKTVGMFVMIEHSRISRATAENTSVFAGYHLGVSNQSCGSWPIFVCDIFYCNLQRTFPIELLDKNKNKGEGQETSFLPPSPPPPPPRSFISLFHSCATFLMNSCGNACYVGNLQLLRCLYLHSMNYNCMLWGNAYFYLSLLSPASIVQ